MLESEIELEEEVEIAAKMRTKKWSKIAINYQFLESRKRFHDFSHSLRSNLVFSLNQGQGSVFTVRECAQSILRLDKPKNRRFSHKNPKMFDFHFNTPTPFPESGSRKHFHVSGMRAIDFSHDFLYRLFWQKNFRRMTPKWVPP